MILHHGFLSLSLLYISLYGEKEEYSRTYHQQSQYGIEQACLFSSYIGYNELGVMGCKEPVPVEQGRCQCQ